MKSRKTFNAVLRAEPRRDERAAAVISREKYGGADAAGTQRDLVRLKAGEPLDYIIGWTPFLGAKIDLSCRPFVPRPETEYWTLRAIDALRKRRKKPIAVLDMFAGSGCIGVAALRRVPRSHVTFVERESRFIEQIKINLGGHRIPRDRFCVIRSDMFDAVRGRFDAILANPPYVGSAAYLDPAVKKYEPRIAYDGGQDGLFVITRFLRDAKNFLKPEGEIWVEFDASQSAAIVRLTHRFGYGHCAVRRDQYGRMRYAVISVSPSTK